MKPHELASVRATLARFPEIREARIFGSRAMGNFKTGSDVDLALYGTGPLACVTRISTLLNQELPLPYYFDVIDYASISNAALRAHIDAFGVSCYVHVVP
ncbi:MAG: nucleotidyltransferase domain-containing protein [Deltaproteobacteria bacterium]|nr:nucleotidyltransferase domain-containing protein [Deltaproteobacteria bacterium]